MVNNIFVAFYPFLLLMMNFFFENNVTLHKNYGFHEYFLMFVLLIAV